MSDESIERRPEWKHDISEADARWLLECSVTRIEHHWEFTSADTTKDWIELHGKIGEKQVSKRFLTNFFTDNRYFRFAPDHARLITPTRWDGERLRADIDRIDAWERKNKRDRAEFERLKRKFEGKS